MDDPGLWDFIFDNQIPTYLTVAPTSTIILGVADHIALCEPCRVLSDSVVISKPAFIRVMQSMPDRLEMLGEIIERRRSAQQFNSMVDATVSERELIEAWSTQLKDIDELSEMMRILVQHINAASDRLPQ